MSWKKLKLVFKGNPLTKDNEKIMGKHGKFFLSEKYKRFERSLAIQFEAQKPKNFSITASKIRVKMKLYFKDKRRRDVQNYPKSILDAFNGVIWLDDSQIYELHLYKDFDRKNPRIEMEVMKID